MFSLKTILACFCILVFASISNGLTYVIKRGTTAMKGQGWQKLTVNKSLTPRSATQLFASKTSTVERYFEYWNQREMDKAVELFTDDCEYEDTLFPNAFRGKSAVRNHLLKVAAGVPDSFQFVIDDISSSNDGKVGVQWHVESNGNQLPFARGCSMYILNKKGYIRKGFDVPEPVIKSGSFSLAILSTATSIINNPEKVIIWAAWGFYCWLLFISDVFERLGLPPSLPVSPDTLSDVVNLSLNYFFVLPLLSPDSSPVLHPGLEALFNFNLAYAGLFAGFWTDGRKGRSISLSPVLLGMQLLTNAVYLPYLALRDNESEVDVKYSDLGPGERLGESRVLPVVLGGVGTFSLFWYVFGRPEFGDFIERSASLREVLSHSVVGVSFILDVIYFALFQGWLVDDDLKRRGVVVGEEKQLKNIAKNIPFFGLVYYFLSRPPLRMK